MPLVLTPNDLEFFAICSDVLLLRLHLYFFWYQCVNCTLLHSPQCRVMLGIPLSAIISGKNQNIQVWNDIHFYQAQHRRSEFNSLPQSRLP